MIQKEKRKAVRERYYDKKETIKQYKKEKHQENRKLNTTYQKEKNHENHGEVQREYKKSIYQENSKIKIEYQKRRYQENPVVHKEYQKKKYKKYQENKKNCDKVMYFLQVKQGPYYICTVCHRSLYQCSVRLFKQEKYHILTEELYHPVKSFDTKLYICETCHKHLIKNEIPCQAVCNKMALSLIPDI